MTTTKEFKMTVAQKFKNSDMPFNEIVEQADKIAVEADQEWELRQTTFKFSDGSELMATYPNTLRVL